MTKTEREKLMEMADYISREDALLALCSTVHCGEEVPCRNQIVSCRWNATRVQDYAESILAIPSVDVAPVRRGKWKWSHGGECSVCGYRNSNFEYKYCPNCGADMRPAQMSGTKEEDE